MTNKDNHIESLDQSELSKVIIGANRVWIKTLNDSLASLLQKKDDGVKFIRNSVVKK